MIKLENISAKKIIPYGDLEIQKLVMDTKATSVKDLINHPALKYRVCLRTKSPYLNI